MTDIASILEAAGVHVQRYKANDAASVAADPRHGSTLSSKDQEMNTATDTTSAPAPAIEDANLKVIRLAMEIASALDECDGYEMVVIHRKSLLDYPVQLCLMEDYARSTAMTFAYRDAMRELLALPHTVSPRSKQYRATEAKVERARQALNDSLYGEVYE